METHLVTGSTSSEVNEYSNGEITFYYQPGKLIFDHYRIIFEREYKG